MARRGDMALLACLVLGLLAARVGAVHWTMAHAPESVFVFDSRDYENTALALLQTGRFAVSPAEPATPQIRRTPGYPVFIAAVYKVFGQDRRAHLDAQAALGVLVVPLVFWFGKRRWGRGGAWAAALIFALDPVSFIHSGMILSETLFTLLLVAGLAAAAGVLNSRHAAAWAAAAGVALALATLTRPIAYYLIVPILVWLAVARRRAAIKPMIAMFLPWLLLVGGWQLHNYRITGRPVLSTIGELNMFAYRAAGVVALRDGISIQEARARLDATIPPALDTDARDRWMGREGLRIVMRHPALAFRTQVVGCLKMLFGPADAATREFLYGRFGNFGSVGWMFKTAASPETLKWLAAHPAELARMAYVQFYGLLVYVLLAAALWVIWRRPEARSPALDWLLWGAILYFVVISAGPEANPRFRVPIMPMMAVVAGILPSLPGGWKKGKK